MKRVKQKVLKVEKNVNQALTLRKKPEMRARFILVQLSWHPKAGGETGSSIRCITSSSSALITTANRKEAWLRKFVVHHTSSWLSARTPHTDLSVINAKWIYSLMLKHPSLFWVVRAAGMICSISTSNYTFTWVLSLCTENCTYIWWRHYKYWWESCGPHRCASEVASVWWQPPLCLVLPSWSRKELKSRQSLENMFDLSFYVKVWSIKVYLLKCQEVIL